MPSQKYDVCLSFAGEDREYVERVAAALRAADVSVFYDRYYEVDLWGKNLYEHLSSVYRDQARYCVMFISRHYAEKLWTKQERRSAQERAFRESEEYILPVRFDDTEVPGLSSVTGYLSVRDRSPEDLAALILVKLERTATSESPQAEQKTQLDPSILKDLLSEEHARIANAYERIAPKSRGHYVAALRARLDVARPEDCAAAMAGLFYIRATAFDADLMRLAQNAPPSVRRRAIFYLGEMKSGHALPLISSAMSDANPDIRATARQAFSKIPGRRPE